MGDAQGGQTGGGYCGCIQEADVGKATSILRLTNAVNAGLAVFAGVYSFVSLGDIATLHVASISVSAYITCFGLLLCCFEIRLSAIEGVVRRRFGFMYTFMGRTLFLLFVASLCFARDQTATIIVGAVTVANAALNAFVMWKHGEVFSDPTDQYATAEEGTATYVRNNPDLAQAAVGAGVNYARENPQLAQAGLQAGANYARNNPEAAQAAAQAAYANSSSSQGNPFAVSKS